MIKDAERPPISSEIRAWLLASAVILVHTVTVTWWAATLSAKMESLSESVLRDRQIYADHEQRIRHLERIIGNVQPR